MYLSCASLHIYDNTMIIANKYNLPDLMVCLVHILLENRCDSPDLNVTLSATYIHKL